MIAWTLAGVDSGGGSGIAADLRAFTGLGVHGCVVVCALTAQNSQRVAQIAAPAPEMVRAQIRTLAEDMPPRALKTGMLADAATVAIVAEELARIEAPLICDPVLVSTSGAVLMDEPTRQALVARLFPRVDLLTPNLPECAALTGIVCTDNAALERAARSLLQLGPKAVLIKGGHGQGNRAQDFYCDANQSFWLSSVRQPGVEARGSGCTLAAAIAALLARGETLIDAVVLAKAYLNQVLRQVRRIGQGPGLLPQGRLPTQLTDIPDLTTQADEATRLSFPAIEDGPLGFYPIVDQLDSLRRLLALGVRTLQLRIKHPPDGASLLADLREAVSLACAHGCRLFINDHWREAIACGAYGVHLGQEDLDAADLPAIAAAGLRLGVSTHGAAEVARAQALSPSYYAVGPVFSTQTKQLAARPRGLENLRFWCELLPRPVVAIGGIGLSERDAVRAAGASGWAVISALHAEANLETSCRPWLDAC